MIMLLTIAGSGVLHPRGIGLASHLGLLCNIPTVGCAKTFLNVDGLQAQMVKQKAQQIIGSGPGHAFLQGKSGRVWGAAFLPSGVKNPIYISAGHMVSLESAISIVRACCLHRIPEPVWQANILSRQKIWSWTETDIT